MSRTAHGSGRRAMTVVLIAAMGMGFARESLAAVGGVSRPAQELPAQRIRASCATTNPYVAAAASVMSSDFPPDADEVAVAAIRDNAVGDASDLIPLARRVDVGTIYGLAFDARRTSFLP